MSQKVKKSPQPRWGPKVYQKGVRWAVDYSPAFLKNLQEKDPQAHDYLIRFLEAEYSRRPELFYKKKRDHVRCRRQNQVMCDDILGSPKNTIRIDGEDVAAIVDATLPSTNPEDALNALIDNRHIISALEVVPLEKNKSKTQKVIRRRAKT